MRFVPTARTPYVLLCLLALVALGACRSTLPAAPTPPAEAPPGPAAPVEQPSPSGSAVTIPDTGDDTPLDDETLVEFLEEKFEFAIEYEQLIVDDDTEVALEELNAMGITRVGQLDGIIPTDYEETAFPLESTNIIGTIRNLLIMYDPQAYVTDAWDEGWEATRDEFAVAIAYGTDLQPLVDAGLLVDVRE